MRVKITVEKVVTSQNKVISFSTAQTQYVEGDNLRFFKGPGDKLVVHQILENGKANQFYTNLAHSSAITTLDAAANATSLQWVLTA
jgi:hypothetical protein